MIKKIAIASIAVLVLAGCAATTNTSDPVPAPGPVVTAPPEPTASPEETFLADLHDMNNYYIENTTDSNLLDIGTSTCSALADGNTIEDIITYLATSGTFDNTDQAEAGGMIIAAAVMDLCPEYSSEVQAYINS